MDTRGFKILPCRMASEANRRYNAGMDKRRIEPGPGQESVWDYPRPPRVEPTSRRIEIVFNDVVIADSTNARRVLETAVGWYYPEPTEPFESIRDHLAFYPTPLDACRVDGEQVTPQPGRFYGGWITSDIVGPFKGSPGTDFW